MIEGLLLTGIFGKNLVTKAFQTIFSCWWPVFTSNISRSCQYLSRRQTRWHTSLGGLTTTPPPLASLSFRADLDTKPEITFCRKYLELPPSLPICFVNYCLCAILKYYSIMSLLPSPANQDCPLLALLQWGSLSEVDSWGSEVSEVLPLSSRSWITWKEPPYGCDRF